jgi:hypothetical protein
LHNRDTRGGQHRGGARGGAHGTDGVVGFYGVAGRGSRAEGSLCDQLCATESALAERVGQDGNVAGIRAGPGQERCADELGRKVGVPTLLPAPTDARRLRVSLRWAFLEVCRAAFRTGRVRTMVYKAHETSRQASMEGVGLPSASVDRRFSMRAYRWSSPRHWARLSPGGQTTRCVVPGARTHPTPGQGVLGRGAGAGTFGSPAGHAPDAGVRIGPQDPADEEDGVRYSVVRSTQPTVGVARKIATFLRGGGVVDFGSAHGQALPMARFYTSSLYWDMSLAGLRATGGPSQAAVPPADLTGRGTKEPYLAPLGPRERPWTKVRLKTALVRSLVRAYDRALDIDALARHAWASPPPYYGGFFLWASRPLSRLWCVLPEWSYICYYLGVAHRRLSAFATQILK